MEVMVVKFPIFILESVFPVISVVLLYRIHAPVLSVYIFISISSWWINPVIVRQWPSSSLLQTLFTVYLVWHEHRYSCLLWGYSSISFSILSLLLYVCLQWWNKFIVESVLLGLGCSPPFNQSFSWEIEYQCLSITCLLVICMICAPSFSCSSLWLVVFYPDRFHFLLFCVSIRSTIEIYIFTCLHCVVIFYYLSVELS